MVLGVLLLMSVSAQAAPIAFSVRAEGDDQLYAVDLGAGTVSAIGPSGFADIEGLTIHPATGQLYGWDDSTDQLVLINPGTGAGTAVGPSGIAPVDVGLTFDQAGNLWLADEGGASNGSLYSVNPLTGAAALVGSLGRDITGLASRNGVIFGVDPDVNSLVTINTATGAATLVGGVGLGFNIDDTGIDFDEAGTLWGIGDTGIIFTINTTTGAGTLVHAASVTRDGFEDLAVAVPEPMALAMVAVGAAMMRRRR
jgi:hypothetical protein